MACAIIVKKILTVPILFAIFCEQQQMIFGILVQSELPICEYFRKIERYVKLERISDCEKKMQFLYSLNSENKLKVKRLGLNRPLNNELIETLEEIEK
jgi:hypothetical protein